MTHDVFVEVITTLGGYLRGVELTELKDNTFYARVIFDQAGERRTVDIRPSDAIALAVRTETPIFVSEAVLDAAGLVAGKAGEEASETSAPSEQSEVDESKLTPFKEFIDTLDLDDLGPGSGEKRS